MPNPLISIILILPIIKSQKLIWSANVNFGSMKWLPWDYFGRTLLYYSENKEYKCSADTDICSNPSIAYNPSTYLMKNNDFYVNGMLAGRTRRFDYNGKDLNYYFSSTNQYIHQFQSIEANDKYFYIKSPESKSLQIYELKQWPNLQILKSLPNQDSSWWIKDNGLFSFKKGSNVSLIRYELDGKKSFTVSIVQCQSNTPDSEIFLASSDNIVYVVCSPQKLIFKLNSVTGIIEKQGTLERNDVVSFACNSEYLFILFKDATIRQYTTDFIHFYTYSVPNTTIPQYNMLKLDSDFLFLILCQINNESTCSPLIAKFSIAKSISISFQIGKHIYSPDIEFTNDSKVEIKVTADVIALPDEAKSQSNAFISPVAFVEDQTFHLFYFSGGQKWGTICDRVSLNQLTIKRNIQNDAEATTKLEFLEINIPIISNSPLTNYASILLNLNERYFYVIHGGTNCIFKSFYSDLFAIDLKSFEYIKLRQSQAIE